MTPLGQGLLATLSPLLQECAELGPAGMEIVNGIELVAHRPCPIGLRALVWERQDPALMGDVAKGIKNFKMGIAEDEEEERPEGGTHREQRR